MIHKEEEELVGRRAKGATVLSWIPGVLRFTASDDRAVELPDTEAPATGSPILSVLPSPRRSTNTADATAAEATDRDTGAVAGTANVFTDAAGFQFPQKRAAPGESRGSAENSQPKTR